MTVSRTLSLEPARLGGLWALACRIGEVCKLRIGFTIALTALAGAAVAPGDLEPWRVGMLGLSVLLASACAGGFNQYMEADLDRRMQRTCRRPFVTGALPRERGWLLGFLGALAVSAVAAGVAANLLAAALVLLGAFVYGGVYTVWLKRRTCLNIVVGGLAGSLAVLAGAAAVSPQLGALAWVLALVLFLWTPSHFWSLAIAAREDYAAAGVPMLPAVIGVRRAGGVVLANSVVLVAVSAVPALMGLGKIYLLGALSGGIVLLATTLRLARAPSRAAAMAAFHASLAQLTLLLVAAMLDARLLGGG